MESQCFGQFQDLERCTWGFDREESKRLIEGKIIILIAWMKPTG